MTTTTTRTALFAITASLTVALASASPAHADTPPYRVDLHVDKAYDSCFFDLHPELTEGQFQEFAAEGGQIARFRQLSAATTLGKGKFDVSMNYAYFFLDDEKGAWNNTMSHPEADHYLGQELGFPQLQLRVGVTDRVDAEAFGTVNFLSNYGFAGVASKVAILRESADMPVSLAVRPSVSGLVGPSEVQVVNLSTDVAVSRNFHGFSPFAGVTASVTAAIDSSDDTDVGNQSAARTLAFAGVEYRWGHIVAAAQAEISDLPGLALRLGGTL